MPREVVVRAPTRIDLGGGWTDVPPYCDREGGFVCNVAITRYARVRLSDSSATRNDRPQRDLVGVALERFGISDDACVELHNDFPVAAGLGGSSAAIAAVLTAIAEWQNRSWKPAEIAEEGRRIEVDDMGVPGGRQDYYAATYGGALALTFTNRVAVRRLPLSDTTRRALPARSVLLYTGESRISGDTITAVLDAYERRESRVLVALRHMRDLAEDMARALERDDLDTVGGLLDEHWEHQRSLHSSIPTPRIDEIVRQAREAGALGAKAMGASGGGCVLVMTRADDIERVRRAVSPLGEVLDFEVDETGVAVERK